MKNDISFLVDSQMTLYEHQSTFNKNMPLRGLLYFRYIVFYNVDQKLPEKSELHLSDSFINFDGKGDFEWTATILNINKDYNKTFQKNMQTIV